MFLPFPFLYYVPVLSFLLSPFPLFLAISYRFIFSLSSTTQTLLLQSPVASVYYQETKSPIWISVLLNCSLFSSPSSFSPPPLQFSSPYYYVPWSPGPACGDFTILPPPLFVLCCYLLQFVALMFTYLFFVLISFLSHAVPVLYSAVGSWCLLVLHVVFLAWNSTGLLHSPWFCFVVDCPFFNQILQLLSSSFLPLCSCECSSVSLSHLLAVVLSQRVSFQICTTTTLPSLCTTWINPIDWHHATATFHCPYCSLYKHHIGAAGFLWMFELWRWDQ